jgi:hypothetical protein
MQYELTLPNVDVNFGLVAVIFLMGSLVMLFFVILSGVTASTPLNNTYFLQASTVGISGARPTTRWGYFHICGDGNTDCWGPWPAPAFGWAWSGNPTNAPAELVGDFGGGTTSFNYYYMWRFGWVFYLIALFFEGMAFFAGFLACCGRLGSAIAGLVSLVALFFLTIAVSLMTYVSIALFLPFLLSLPSHHLRIYGTNTHPHQRNLRQGPQRLHRRRERRPHRHLCLRLQLGCLGRPGHRDYPVLRRLAQGRRKELQLRQEGVAQTPHAEHPQPEVV